MNRLAETSWTVGSGGGGVIRQLMAGCYAQCGASSPAILRPGGGAPGAPGTALWRPKGCW